MNRFRHLAAGIVLSLLLVFSQGMQAYPGSQKGSSPKGTNKIDDCIRVLDEMMKEADKSIPLDLLRKCTGIAIIPDVLKVAYVVGGSHGTGLLIVRRDNRWSDPAFINITSGSIGWQLGVQSTDVILLFMTPRGIDNITQGKFTLGADVGVAVGPVGRNAQAGTDVTMKAEIYSYSRSRGLYAGLSFQGAALQVDGGDSDKFYGREHVGAQEIFEGKVGRAPESVERLRRAVAKYTESRDR